MDLKSTLKSICTLLKCDINFTGNQIFYALWFRLGLFPWHYFVVWQTSVRQGQASRQDSIEHLKVESAFVVEFFHA